MDTKFFVSFGRSAALCCAAILAATSASFGASGVCCIPGLTCTVIDSSLCTGGGRVYKGDGTTCSPNNPCVPPRGACCIATSAVTIPSYTGGGGSTKPCFSWLIRHTTTGGAPLIGTFGCRPCIPICATVPVDTAGPVNWEVDPIICVVIPEINCTTNDGVYHGDNTACTPSLCAPPASVVGACCILSANNTPQCDSRIQADCVIGTFNAGQSCQTQPCAPIALGACCRVDYCFTTSATNCNAESANYRGDGTTCTVACPPPVLGSCCHAGTTTRGAWCDVRYNVICTSPGDVFSSAQTTCATVTCAGACPCDWNKDGFVDGLDLMAFSSDWVAGHGDFNHDGTTNNADYAAFTQCFSGPSTPTCIHH
jgi:hypothetical protein